MRSTRLAMKQYTTPEQTAKLIELGLEKPKSISGYYQRGPYEYDAETNTKMVVYDDTQYPIYAYSIGELIGMLPMTITEKIWWGGYRGKEGVWGLQIQTCGTEYSWEVSYVREYSAHLYLEGRSELADALYDMAVKLKEEGVI